MPSDIKDRLEQAIRVEDEKSLSRLKASHESARDSEEQFQPVRLAAEELREQLQSLPSIEFSINPDSVWITLADRDLRFSYNIHTRDFVGEEGAHSWYDGEAYADRYEWHTAEACIDAMIRLCAKYVRMARAIGAATGQSWH
jgi:hypothetical protein